MRARLAIKRRICHTTGALAKLYRKKDHLCAMRRFNVLLQELKENCMKSLAEVGASDEVCTVSCYGPRRYRPHTNHRRTLSSCRKLGVQPRVSCRHARLICIFFGDPNLYFMTLCTLQITIMTNGCMRII